MAVTATTLQLADVLPPKAKEESRRSRRGGGGKAADARALRRQECYDNQFYKTKLCLFWQNGQCAREDSCKFAHGVQELQTAPNLTGTSMCKTMLKTGTCEDPDCQFAHDATTLRATDQFYKTTMCHFQRYGTCKLGEACRHAHGVAELRSSPVRGNKAPSQVGSEVSTVAPTATCGSLPSLHSLPQQPQPQQQLPQQWQASAAASLSMEGLPEVSGSSSSEFEDEEFEVLDFARAVSMPYGVEAIGLDVDEDDDDDSFLDQNMEWWSRCSSAPAQSGVPAQALSMATAAAAPLQPSTQPATRAEAAVNDGRFPELPATHWSRFQSEPCRDELASIQRRPVPKHAPTARPLAGSAPSEASMAATLPIFNQVVVAAQQSCPIVLLQPALAAPMAAGVVPVAGGVKEAPLVVGLPGSPTGEVSESSLSQESTPRQVPGVASATVPIAAYPIAPSVSSSSSQVNLVGYFQPVVAPVGVDASLIQQVLENAQPDHYEE